MEAKKILVVKTELYTEYEMNEMQFKLTELLGKDYYVIVVDGCVEIELLQEKLTTLELSTFEQ